MMVSYKFMSSKARAPFRNGNAAGYDLYACESLDLQPGETRRCDTGLAFQIPDGLEGQVRGRSGLASEGKQVVTGTVDPDYRGSVSAILYNASRSLWRVKAGDRIAQIVFARVATVALDAVSELSETVRGASGFGSSGT